MVDQEWSYISVDLLWFFAALALLLGKTWCSYRKSSNKRPFPNKRPALKWEFGIKRPLQINVSEYDPVMDSDIDTRD